MSKKYKNDFQIVERQCIERGASLRKVTNNRPYDTKTAGFVVRDVNGRSTYYRSLSEVVFAPQVKLKNVKL